jgi:uncharacterized Zn-finger protein
MQPLETIYTDSMIAACNGGGGPLGHPRVYLNLSPSGQIECPYCSRLFVHESKRAGHATDGHGVEVPSATTGREVSPAEHDPPAAPASSAAGGTRASRPENL